MLAKKSVILFFVALCGIASAQTFEEKTVDAGNIGLNVTNVGTLGRPNVRNTPDGPPSMEYPLNSGIEHLFEGGFWIGAQVGGEIRVSSSAVDAASGYSTGRSGFEFTALGPITERSTLTNSDYYSGAAVSHQDMVINITDSNVYVPGSGIPISNHQYPLKAVVHQETYAWNYSFADFFVIVNYEITNKSNNRWDSVYLGFWSDMVVRNVNVTQDGGAAFFSKGGAGMLKDQTSFYVFQVSGDDAAYTRSYGAARILGVDWRNEFLHPANANRFVELGYPKPRVNYNFWEYNSTTGLTVFPATDNAKYTVLKKSLGDKIPDYDNRLRIASNKVQLISIGPIPSIEPGETVTFALALVCAKQLPDPNATQTTDTEVARKELYDHLDWAKRTYIGEDVNENGELDAGEDLNDNGKLDKYILPEPPKDPQVKFVPNTDYLDIYWTKNSIESIDPISKKHDFEGFKLYRSNAGDDLSLDLISSSNLIAQWDSMGNDVGFNNGFKEIELEKPVTIDGVEYFFHYRINGLLSGWQYMFILTAFDEGDKELKLDPLESSFSTNNYRLFLGTDTAAAENKEWEVGVYPNPFRTTAAWDGESSLTHKMYFTNLPASCTITIYTSAGELVDQFEHNATNYNGDDIRWFNDYGGEAEKRVFAGGEHAWDLLSKAGQSVAQGTYMYSVTDNRTGKSYQGTFAVLR
ncbi:hypothetical protein GC194_15190 [bacterium]|nr:hypothetical protein [bacterium]